MSTLRSFKSIRSAIKTPEISRRRLGKYSWLPEVIRIEGSILTRIFGPVFTVTIFASIIATLNEIYGYHIHLSNNVVPLLSVVVGLILVFRNSTSYDRWYEGSKMFGSLISNTRNLARLTWVYVNPAPAMSEKQHQTFLSLKGKAAFDPNSAYEGSLLRGEKVRLLKLVIAFAYAVKNHLRQNFESENEELSGLLPPEMGEFLADWNGAFVGGRYGTDAGGSGSVLGEGLTESAISTAVAGNGNGQGDGSGSKTNGAPTRKNTQATARTPLLSDPGDTIVSFHPPGVDKILPLPLIITHEITNIVYKFKKAGCLETVGPAGVSSLMGLVQGMTDQLSTMERISTTPIPGSYSIHLKQCITLYLFALPFTLVEDLHWRMIPIVTVVAFTLMGIEGIADEIEMPFGRDRSDLPLDRLCDELRAEVTYIIEKMPEGSDDT